MDIIKPKYNIGDTVYFYHNRSNELRHSFVIGIKMNYNRSWYEYTLDGQLMDFIEHELFSSKEDFLERLKVIK